MQTKRGFRSSPSSEVSKVGYKTTLVCSGFGIYRSNRKYIRPYENS